MSTWRVSVDARGRTEDLVIDAEDNTPVQELWDQLTALGIDASGLQIDGRPADHLGPIGESPLTNGSIISDRRTAPAPGPGWYLVTIAGADTGSVIPIGEDPIVVGRSNNCDVQIDDAAMSGNHFRISTYGQDVMLGDLGSTNGTLLEGVEVTESTPCPSNSYFQAGSTTFGVFEIQPEDIPTRAAKVGSAAPFQRRFRDALEPLPKELTYPKEPEDPTNRGRSIASMMIPMVSAVGFATITGRWQFMFIMLLSPLFYIYEGRRQKKQDGRDYDTEMIVFREKREELEVDLLNDRTEELRRDRWQAAPAGLAPLIATSGHERLWERLPSDPDFGTVAIGLTETESNIVVKNQPEDLELPMETQWSGVQHHSLVGEGALALNGPIERARALGRALLLDLATSHSPNELKLWLLTSEENEAEWNGLRWTPHNFLADSQNRIFATPALRAGGMSILQSIVTERKAASAQPGSKAFTLPIHIVVIDCLDELDPAEVTDLLVDGARVGVIGITIDESVNPEGTNAELELGQMSDEAQFVSKSQPRAGGIRSFEMSADTFEAATRSLAKFKPAGSSSDVVNDAGIIRLVDLIDATTETSEVDSVIARWRSTGGTSRVTVGGLGEMTTQIDIMKDGPHGLVGGTTRSGKTEFLKSLITSLACENHPDDLSIVIVDFKGGVDHELSARLPHVVDLSTNHNVDSFVRTVRLIEAEMLRRQREFKAVGAPNYDAYRAARAQDPSLAPIPRLMLVVDEFSEMLSSEKGKENLSSLESVTRVGGGLGVHLLLVTQNFENQLPNQIAANAGLRICFRVQDDGHSKVVLDAPNAASIPKERIGRAFLRSHGGRLVEFQAARVAGPRPGKEVFTEAVRAKRAPFVTLAESPPEAPIVDVPAEDTDMYAVVDVIRDAAKKSGWTKSAVPWPKQLPNVLPLTKIAGKGSWPIGMVDEPERQRQTVANLADFGPHTMLIGSPTARLDEAVRSIVVSGAAHKTAAELHVYAIDVLGQGMSSLLALPHTGGVAERNEPLSIRILSHIAQLVAQRKAQMAERQVSDIAELAAMTGQTIADVLAVIHGIDRVTMVGETDQSPLVGPLRSILPEAVGTGVRFLFTGPPTSAGHRVASPITQRYVFECADPSEYLTVGVPRELRGFIDGPLRAIDTDTEKVIQLGSIPVSTAAPAAEIIKEIGARSPVANLPQDSLPAKIAELPWPLQLADLPPSKPADGVLQPVALNINANTGDLAWLDAEEDGPVFVVTGPTKSGRSNALVAAAAVMADHGWETIGVAPSRRSPMGSKFVGTMVNAGDLADHVETERPLAVFIDDVHKFGEDVEGVKALLARTGPKALIIAGPTEFLTARNDLTRLFTPRSVLLLTPRGALDGSNFGVRRLPDTLLRDQRAGRGVLMVAGEISLAQTPLAI